jgi:hypothetical protein
MVRLAGAHGDIELGLLAGGEARPRPGSDGGHDCVSVGATAMLLEDDGFFPRLRALAASIRSPRPSKT